MFISSELIILLCFKISNCSRPSLSAFNQLSNTIRNSLLTNDKQDIDSNINIAQSYYFDDSVPVNSTFVNSFNEHNSGHVLQDTYSNKKHDKNGSDKRNFKQMYDKNRGRHIASTLSEQYINNENMFYNDFKTYSLIDHTDNNDRKKNHTWFNAQCTSFLVQDKLVIHGNLNVQGKIFILSSTNLLKYEKLNDSVIYNETYIDSNNSNVIIESLDKFGLKLCYKTNTIINGSLDIMQANLIIGGGLLYVTGSTIAKSMIEIDGSSTFISGHDNSKDMKNYIDIISDHIKKNNMLFFNHTGRCPFRSNNSVTIYDGLLHIQNASTALIVGDLIIKAMIVDSGSLFKHYCGIITEENDISNSETDIAILGASEVYLVHTNLFVKNCVIEEASRGLIIGDINIRESFNINANSKLIVYGNTAVKLLFVNLYSQAYFLPTSLHQVVVLDYIINIKEGFVVGNYAKVNIHGDAKVNLCEFSRGVTILVKGTLQVNNYITIDDYSNSIVEKKTVVKKEIEINNNSLFNSSEIIINGKLKISQNSNLLANSLISNGCYIVVQNNSNMSLGIAKVVKFADCDHFIIFSSKNSKTYIENLSLLLDSLESYNNNNDSNLLNKQNYNHFLIDIENNKTDLAINHILLTEHNSQFIAEIINGSAIILVHVNSIVMLEFSKLYVKCDAVEITHNSVLKVHNTANLEISVIKALSKSHLELNADNEITFGKAAIYSNSDITIESQKITVLDRLEVEERSTAKLYAENILLPKVVAISVKSDLIVGTNNENCNNKFSILTGSPNSFTVRDFSKLYINNYMNTQTNVNIDLHTNSILSVMCQLNNAKIYVTPDSIVEKNMHNAKIVPALLNVPLNYSPLLINLVPKLNVDDKLDLSNPKDYLTDNEKQDISLKYNMWRQISRSVDNEQINNDIENKNTLDYNYFEKFGSEDDYNSDLSSMRNYITANINLQNNELNNFSDTDTGTIISSSEYITHRKRRKK